MQHNDEKKPNRLRRLLAGKGYYIALVLCIAAVGISGYVLIRALQSGGGTEEATLGVPVTVEEVPEAARSTAAGTDSAGAELEASDPETGTDSAAGTGESATEDAAAAETAQTVEAAALDDMDSAEAAVRAQAALTVTWPVSGEISQGYSVDALSYNVTMNDWRTHEGIDIAALEGQTVMAAQAGVVSAVYADDFLGTVVVIDHDGGIQTLYANLNTIPAVEAGDEVEAGTVIGAVSTTALGESGDVSHLHFEVLQDGQTIDPVSYLP